MYLFNDLKNVFFVFAKQLTELQVLFCFYIFYCYFIIINIISRLYRFFSLLCMSSKLHLFDQK